MRYVQVDSLLHLHDRSKWSAPNGAKGTPPYGSAAPKRLRPQLPPPEPLRVPVPLGTIVRGKKGHVLADLQQVGDTCRVCSGGAAGRGVIAAPSTPPAPKPSTKKERQLEVRI